jgi:hypothetical protein
MVTYRIKKVVNPVTGESRAYVRWDEFWAIFNLDGFSTEGHFPDNKHVAALSAAVVSVGRIEGTADATLKFTVDEG